MEKTAVEWLEDQVIAKDWLSEKGKNIFEQAKEMEKQQIIEARITAPLLPSIDKLIYLNEAQQYYNETFKTK